MKRVLFVILSLFSIVFANSLEEGIKAYQAGEIEKAGRIFMKLCNENDMAGCNNLAAVYENIQGNEKEAMGLYQKSCEGGYLLACSNLAAMLGADELEQKEALYKKACINGAMMGCYNLGYLYEQQAVLLYELSCKNGINMGCNNYNRMKNSLK